jgi:hypothetical protein
MFLQRGRANLLFAAECVIWATAGVEPRGKPGVVRVQSRPLA